MAGSIKHKCPKMFYPIPDGNRMAMGTRQQRERQEGLWIPALIFAAAAGIPSING
jgi:hypothetical protein